MPFPSSTGTKGNTDAKAFDGVQSVASLVKADSIALRGQSAAGPVGASAIRNYLTRLADNRVQLVAYTAVPGIDAYALARTGDSAIIAEYTTMLAAMDACLAWVITNYPKDGSAYLLDTKFNAQGRTVDRTFSTAELATFRTQLDALIATID